LFQNECAGFLPHPLPLVFPPCLLGLVENLVEIQCIYLNVDESKGNRAKVLPRPINAGNIQPNTTLHNRI